MKGIIFLIHEAEEGGYHAEAVGIGVFAEGETMDELKKNIKGGIDCFYAESKDAPIFAHLHFVKNELMAL